VVFKSGAALTVLDALVSNPAYGVPVKLLANQLALKAAPATSKLEGRLAREADIRDAYHLTTDNFITQCPASYDTQKSHVDHSKSP